MPKSEPSNQWSTFSAPPANAPSPPDDQQLPAVVLASSPAVISTAEITVARQRGRPFLPGQSGNPAGRPNGAKNRFTETFLDIVAKDCRIKAVCAEWPAYGYRRVTAKLHDEGRIVNHKKVMRLMKENGLTVRPRRRFIATTDSDHDGPIFPDLANDIVPTKMNSSGSAPSCAGIVLW
jgi:transposase InsO family protein